MFLEVLEQQLVAKHPARVLPVAWGHLFDLVWEDGEVKLREPGMYYMSLPQEDFQRKRLTEIILDKSEVMM